MSKLTGIRRADLFKDHGSGVPVTGENPKVGARTGCATHDRRLVAKS
jgi:hypothetical protein